MRRRIEVTPYDPRWPGLYESEATVLRGVFHDDLVSIHHVGSTAVPGLSAKPTIDILVVVGVGAFIEGYYARMHDLGFECRGECLDAVVPGTPGRFYFPKRAGHVHLVHVHVCREGHHQVPEMLAFRDYLRAHPRDAQRYAERKLTLAGEFVYDNVGYMRGKDEAVRDLIAKAERWQAKADRPAPSR